MFLFKLLSCAWFFFLMVTFAASVADLGFQYNGFVDDQNLHRDGMEDTTPDGILWLTNTERKYAVGHCFYSNPDQFHSNSSSSSANEYHADLLKVWDPSYEKRSVSFMAKMQKMWA
ncbi:hypothetical protein C5167_000082 [Papaver somniferum]|uniref:Legume lectin domain-containing protein n=1 Tax=Papaver somniferum TaxID=3469 RepID=A0A4Y7KUS2_PAPSO|nr:hypothetical protein C5167_000082 [Papaver somniferum]